MGPRAAVRVASGGICLKLHRADSGHLQRRPVYRWRRCPGYARQRDLRRQLSPVANDVGFEEWPGASKNHRDGDEALFCHTTVFWIFVDGASAKERQGVCPIRIAHAGPPSLKR